jgi:thiamine pyrophosphokinase
VELWEGAQTAWLLRPPGGEIRGQVGDTVSLIPLAGDAVGITTFHLAYPLQAENLQFGAARGISNLMTGSAAQVSLREGLLMVVHTPGHA